MSNAVAEPTTREEIEAILRAKVESGEAETGLYDTGTFYVVVTDNAGEGVAFQWFNSPMQLSDVLNNY